MAGPWEAFQDNAAAALAKNDEAIAAPPRAAVQPTQRVWGDAEARQAGLYESTPGPWSAFQQKPQTPQQPQVQQPQQPQGQRAPLRITVNPVNSRFGEMQPPESGAGAMQEGLDQRGLQLMRGPEQSPAAQMAVGHENAMAAASQRTSPDVSQYGGKLISTETFQDDGGGILYRDPETKALKPTNNSTQVVIRDPADGTVKVFERSDATNEGAFTGAARVATQGMMVGAPTARAALPSAQNVVPKASDIFSTAKAPYRAFDAEAAHAAPILADEAKVMVDRVQNALDVAHLPSEVAKQVHDTVALIGKKGDTALSQLQYVKRAVGNLFKSPDENVRSGAAVATKEIVRMISEASRSAGQNLKRADDIHSTARSVQSLQRKSDIANLRTGRAGYGGNAVNNLRTQLEKVVEASVNGRQTGFKPNEIQAMREISDGTKATNALRLVGAMSPSKGIMQIGAGITTGGITAALGAAANKLATIMTAKQIERLNELVAKRSPAYAEAVAKAVTKFEQAQIEFANNPAPNRLAGLVSASRALSAGLTRDGIQITSGDILKSIRGPMQSAADDQQDPVPRVPSQ